MKNENKALFSGPVEVFHEKWLPETGTLAGYAALIDAYALKVPLPRILSATGERHRTIERDGWRILTPRHAPKATLEGHLTFALKYEGLNLAVLKRLFQAVGATPIEALVRETPTGAYARRIWFLYEWLTDTKLEIPDATDGKYAPVVDPAMQWAVKGKNVRRQRVKNNLPGTREFCPLVFRTEAMNEFVALNLSEQALKIAASVPRDVLARTAAFLLLKDSKSSYAIEGESPPQDRIQRWSRAIGEAGRRPLEKEALLRLQTIVIGDTRFLTMGFRTEGGFVGEHDRNTRAPLPEHISTRPEDLNSLLNGMVEFASNAANELDPVIAATILAFGFVYIHPFEDGNGRIHRYLIHHVLAQRGFNPPGVVFPVSAAILDRIEKYKAALESYSARLLPVTEWEPTEENNVRVLNDTGDFYRYFDATPHAEFLYECVKQTIEHDLPEEAQFLQRYDRFRQQIEALFDMPDRTLDLLFHFLHQNEGKLSIRAKTKEFKDLTEKETERVQSIYGKIFEAA